jgi:hypothetical protein
VRIETPGLCRLPAFPQEQVRQVARRNLPVYEEEFVLEADPANRKRHSPPVLNRFLRESFGQESLPPGGIVDVWGICEHLYLGPFISSPLTQYRQHAGRIAIDLRM